MTPWAGPAESVEHPLRRVERRPPLAARGFRRRSGRAGADDRAGRGDLELTSTEVGRSLQRLIVTDQLDAEKGERVWASYSVASQHWHMYRIDDDILLRARQAFPREPLRTLDAIHLATAMRHALEVGAPSMLSLDRQVRANAQALGLGIVP